MPFDRPSAAHDGNGELGSAAKEWAPQPGQAGFLKGITEQGGSLLDNKKGSEVLTLQEI